MGLVPAQIGEISRQGARLDIRRVLSLLSGVIVFTTLGCAPTSGNDGQIPHEQESPAQPTPKDKPKKPAPRTPTVLIPPDPGEAPNQEIVIAAVGDIMLGTTWPNARRLPPADGANLLAEVTPLLSAADVVFGNLEGPLIDGGSTNKCRKLVSNCYAFRVPTRYGQHLKNAGFNVMSLANNHALDFGVEGRESTKTVLNSLGIAHSGEVGDIAHLTIKGGKIDVIAFSPYETTYDLNDLESAKAAVAESASQADLVLVSFHGGAEGDRNAHVPRRAEKYLGENRGNLRKFAHAVIDAGAALVIGHGPHRVRGMEVYKDRLIAYSLGNFATYGPFNLAGPRGYSMILEARLGMDGKFHGGRIHAIKQTKPGGPTLDPKQKIIPMVKALSGKDFGAKSVKISEDGSLLPP